MGRVLGLPVRSHHDDPDRAMFFSADNSANQTPMGQYKTNMAPLAPDLRYSLRGIRRSPLLASIAVLSLALGIGANTAIFTIMDQLMLRPLPVKDPASLVMLYQMGRRTATTMAIG